jgi:ubiquinol-cytochrome c reductase cytochrome b subunit
MVSLYLYSNIVIEYVVRLPASKSLGYWWNVGRILGMVLGLQIITGRVLSCYYVSSGYMAYESVEFICREVSLGIIFRVFHLNGATLLFIILYLHVFRGLFIASYRSLGSWWSGISILILMIITAFVGYVLPWGQISYWGATVITNLVSSVPVVGSSLVIWLWGGFSVNERTLGLYFTIHYLLPHYILAIVVLHLSSLHDGGSSNIVGLIPLSDKHIFYPYYWVKDAMNATGLILVELRMIIGLRITSEPLNSIPANRIRSPVHIKPEWYFLFAYAILRAIPNKLGGVISLVISVSLFSVIRIAVSTRLVIFDVTSIWCW